MKRGRNQRRRQGVNVNRALDSNGPDVRIRGTANQIYDKYQSLARDASSSGDRVKAESYLQHAEHYFRIIKSMQGQNPNQNSQSSNPNNANQNNSGEQQNTSVNASDNTLANADAAGKIVEENADTVENKTVESDEPIAGSEEKERPKQKRARRPRQSDSAKSKTTSPDEEKPVKRTRRKKVETADAL